MVVRLGTKQSEQAAKANKSACTQATAYTQKQAFNLNEAYD